MYGLRLMLAVKYKAHARRVGGRGKNTLPTFWRRHSPTGGVAHLPARANGDPAPPAVLGDRVLSAGGVPPALVRAELLGGPIPGE